MVTAPMRAERSSVSLPPTPVTLPLSSKPAPANAKVSAPVLPRRLPTPLKVVAAHRVARVQGGHVDRRARGRRPQRRVGAVARERVGAGGRAERQRSGEQVAGDDVVAAAAGEGRGADAGQRDRRRRRAGEQGIHKGQVLRRARGGVERIAAAAAVDRREGKAGADDERIAALPPKRRGVPEKATLPVLSVTVPALLPVTDQVVARSRPVSVEVVPLPTKAPTFDQAPLIGLAVPALAPASVKFAAPATAERSSGFAAPVPPLRLPPSVPPPLKLKLSAAVPPASEKAPWNVVVPSPSLTLPLPLPVIVKVEPVLLPVRVVLLPFPTSVVTLL
jgi:hypothetical protein